MIIKLTFFMTRLHPAWNLWLFEIPYGEAARTDEVYIDTSAQEFNYLAFCDSVGDLAQAACSPVHGRKFTSVLLQFIRSYRFGYYFIRACVMFS